MKIIKYRFLSAAGHGTEEQPNIGPVFFNKSMGWSEANEALAKREAYNGEYSIEDDGQPENDTPTAEERITELEEALALILSGDVMAVLHKRGIALE